MIDRPDPVTLALFSNRFMGIAEAMGNALRHTSVSTNIKERLDFSCALFAADGSLVSNAPHLPIHLGSMSFAVTHQIKLLGFGENAESGNGIVEGDVLLSNSPTAGGSHLPDITVITPVFSKGEIVFFTASRGHHADVGGISPGSMSPLATTIFQEGARIESFKIVRKGVYDSEGLRKRLIDEPASYPGSSGSRSYADVESDLKAQIAANHKGIQLINSLIEEWGLPIVQRYMGFITDNAEQAVRSLLKRTVEKLGRSTLHAIDYMDDGTAIELNITISTEGDAVFDFTGTGFESWSSLNAPFAVAASSVIYCLRALVNQPIPLNSGCLRPIDLRIPEGTILNPSSTAAVVGGNVTTSQRVTDVILLAFSACSASQGCCNNLTFGTEGFGFYETVAGGTGAGDGWHGTTCHSGSTNTRITDVEIMERRYPVVIREFSIREGSGGKGQFNGGNGVVRDLEFTIPDVTVSILSERRVRAPYGMAGGEEGGRGKNTWVKQRRAEDGDLKEGAGPRYINLGPRNTVKFGKGDRFILHTPGGGGYGSKSNAKSLDSEDKSSASTTSPTSTFRGFMGSLAERAAAQLGV
ncbi:hypothetical protein JCM5350_006140 [Sporobolomyces pararoseus]